jgi:hypothetical protein
MLFLNIGGIEIEIISEEEDSIKEVFPDFLSEAKSSLSLRLRVRKRNKCFFPSKFSNVYPEDEKIIVAWKGVKGYINLKTLDGEIDIISAGSLEIFLRIIYSIILPNIDGLAIHASSLIRNGKAYVFPGESGAGKTTIIRLSPNISLLTDEVSIIRGIGKNPMAYGTPFYGSLGIPGENISAPVTGIYFPVKDKKNYIEELDTKLALRKFIRNVGINWEDQNLKLKAFNLACELVSAVPCYDLHFLPDPSFWDCIDERERRD